MSRVFALFRNFKGLWSRPNSGTERA
jgi:hypothetical protein